MTDSTPDFIPGLKLARLFFGEAVKPILAYRFVNLRYSAALIGSGSEVLGFDTEMSADHHWGPRVMLFLSEDDHKHYSQTINETLRNELPSRFLGYSTNFTLPNPADHNTQLLQDVDDGAVNHRVDILTIGRFTQDYLNFDIKQPIAPAEWLTFPEQKLRTIAAGEVYHDDIGLQEIRDRFEYYPHDIWLYLLASGWNRIGQEEHLMGRAGMVGDEIGSALIGARLVRDIMRLCFLMEKQYAPYAKWLGTAFNNLKCGIDLSPALRNALQADTWQQREKYLAQGYEYIAAMHNRLCITEPLLDKVSNFFGRPFQVINSVGGFAEAISARITDPIVKEIADRKLIGNIDQISDNTDITSDAQFRLTLRKLYE